MFPSSIVLITSFLTIIAAALIGGATARLLKQPMILGYIAGGLLFGTVASSLINREFVTLISDAGVTLLLFTLGIEFSFVRLRKVLGVISWAVIVQILLTLLIFLLLLLLFGLSFLPALFLAASASLSSTAIVVKLLSERGELETVPGELATGWLVLQDLAVVPMMVIVPAVASVVLHPGQTFVNIITILSLSLLKAGIFLAVIIYLGRKGLPQLLNLVAAFGSQEIMIITVVGIVFLNAVLAYAVGLSAPLGAFIAGLLIAETSQNHAVFAEVRPLRDLFVVVFFVSLGLLLPVGYIVSLLPWLIFLTASIIFIKWFLVMGLSRFLGYHRKTAFILALSLTQISEFGFIIGKEGVRIGALSGSDNALLIALIFTTIFVTSPLVSQSQAIYYRFYQFLGRFWPKIFREKAEMLPQKSPEINNHIIICGYGRVGKYIGRALTMENIPFIVVDYNQATVRSLRDSGLKVIYGDPADRDILSCAGLSSARALVIAIPDRHTQELIIGNTHSLNRRIKIICRTHHEEDQKDLKALGVTTVIQPEFEAAVSIVNRILTDFGVTGEDIAGKVSRLKIEHGLG